MLNPATVSKSILQHMLARVWWLLQVTGFIFSYSEGAKAVAAPRPDRLVNRLKSINVDDASAPRLTVLRQPRGPDNSKVC